MVQNKFSLYGKIHLAKLLHHSYYGYCPAGLCSYSNTVIEHVLMFPYGRKFYVPRLVLHIVTDFSMYNAELQFISSVLAGTHYFADINLELGNVTFIGKGTKLLTAVIHKLLTDPWTLTSISRHFMWYRSIIQQCLFTHPIHRR
jgi:hypothetical protein